MRICRVLFLLPSLAAVLVHPGFGVTFTVNTFADTHDSSPGNGLCRDDSLKCSLRAAVEETNALSSQDTVNLPVGLFHLVGEAEGTSLVVSGYLEILGTGAATTIIDGSGLAGVLTVTGRLTLRDVTVRNGNATFGGGIDVFGSGYASLNRVHIVANIARYGGGLHVSTAASALLVNCVVSDNSARPAAIGVGLGGGVYNDGFLEIIQSLIARNTTPLGLAHAGMGGGIYNRGTLAISNSTLSSNVADLGSALLDYDYATADLLLTTVAANVGTAIATLEPRRPLGLQMTLLADNFPHNCQGSMVESHNDNLSDDASCNLTRSRDRVVADAKLGPLSSGVHVPEPRSPVIDGIPGDKCPFEGIDDTDQIQQLRPVDGDYNGAARCDIGAFEVQQDPIAIDLAGGRFHLSVTWKDFENKTGLGRVNTSTADSSFFWFFSQDNIEISAKVLRACSINGKYWVLISAATNVEFAVRVEDLESGLIKTYRNTLGAYPSLIADTSSFACD